MYLFWAYDFYGVIANTNFHKFYTWINLQPEGTTEKYTHWILHNKSPKYSYFVSISHKLLFLIQNETTRTRDRDGYDHTDIMYFPVLASASATVSLCLSFCISNNGWYSSS